MNPEAWALVLMAACLCLWQLNLLADKVLSAPRRSRRQRGLVRHEWMAKVLELFVHGRPGVQRELPGRVGRPPQRRNRSREPL